MSRTGNNLRAVTMLEVLVIIAGLAILLALFLPAVARRNARSSRIGCVNFLKQTGLAFRTWALDNTDRFPMRQSVTNGGTLELVASGRVFPHFLVMSNELSTPKILACPEDTRICSISFAREFDDSNLSYFVGVDAAEESPSSWLAGDRNLTNRLPAGAVLLPLTTNFTIGWDKKIHSKKGNVLFGDGHVDSVLNYPPSMSGQTNRLAIP